MLALNGNFLARYLARNVHRGNDLRQGGGHQGGGLHQRASDHLKLHRGSGPRQRARQHLQHLSSQRKFLKVFQKVTLYLLDLNKRCKNICNL